MNKLDKQIAKIIWGRFAGYFPIMESKIVSQIKQTVLKDIEEVKPSFKKNGVIDGVPASDRIDDAYNSGIKDFESVIKDLLK